MAGGRTGRTSSKSNNEKNCGKCKKDLNDGTTAMLCEICSKWFHANCTDLDPATIEIISKLKTTHWYCANCNDTAVDVIQQITSLKQLQKSLSTDIINLGGTLIAEIAQVNQRLDTDGSYVHQDR